MKLKTISLVAVAIMMVSLFAVTAMAANGNGDMQKDQDRLKDCTLVVDTDGDGICDNFVDEDGDKVCDNCIGTGDCDGDQARDGSCNEDCGGTPDQTKDQDKKRDGSCQS